MEQRRNAIVELVNREGSLSFVQLKEAFPSVSEMTLRTDLKHSIRREEWFACTAASNRSR